MSSRVCMHPGRGIGETASAAPSHCASGPSSSSAKRDFNPRRVTVARVHGGLHPRRVHKEETLSIPPCPSPTKDLPHSGRSSRSRRSPCPYKLLGSTPQLDGGSQATPNQSRRHHSTKGNRLHMKVKRRFWRRQTHTEIFGVVPIGGAIVRPR